MISACYIIGLSGRRKGAFCHRRLSVDITCKGAAVSDCCLKIEGRAQPVVQNNVEAAARYAQA